jgi:hypothetical protein
MASLVQYAERAGVDPATVKGVVFVDMDRDGNRRVFGPAAASLAERWTAEIGTGDLPEPADSYWFLIDGSSQDVGDGYVIFVNRGRLRAVVYRYEPEGRQTFHVFGEAEIMEALQLFYEDDSIVINDDPFESWTYDPRIHDGEQELVVVIGIRTGGYLVYIDGPAPGHVEDRPAS